MKLTRPLPATLPKALTYAEGNFAHRFDEGLAGACSAVLVDAQWIVLVLALVLFVRGGRAGIAASIGGVWRSRSPACCCSFCPSGQLSATCRLIRW